MTDHDPRIVALARDPRTGPQWQRLVDTGNVGGNGAAFLPFSRACTEHGLLCLTYLKISKQLLAYVRDIANDLLVDERNLIMEHPAARPQSVNVGTVMLFSLQGRGLLDEDYAATPLGDAVRRVLEVSAP